MRGKPGGVRRQHLHHFQRRLARPVAVRPVPVPDRPDALPAVSMLVPLLCEAEITDSLIAHLSAIEYPPDKLEILLVTEAGDRRAK